MQEVDFEVTEQDLREGKRFRCCLCPLALALSRRLGLPVSVGETFIWRREPDAFSGPRIGETTPLMREFIESFDDPGDRGLKPWTGTFRVSLDLEGAAS